MARHAKHLAKLLRSSGQLDEAEALAARHGVSRNGWEQRTDSDGDTYWWRTNEAKSNGVEISLADPDV